MTTVTDKKIVVYYLINGRIIIGATIDLDDSDQSDESLDENFYYLYKPLEIRLMQNQQGQPSINFTSPFFPLHPPKDEILMLSVTSVQMYMYVDSVSNTEMYKNYVQATSGIIMASGPTLHGGTY